MVRWLPAMMRTAVDGAERDLIDVLRRNLGLDDEVVGARHDQHDGLAVADHAADRVNGQLMDDARSRRADVDALELILGARCGAPSARRSCLGPRAGL